MIEEENTEVTTEPIEIPTEPVEEDPQLTKLKVKIPYDEDVFGTNENYEVVLNDLLEDSKNILLETLYPFTDFTDYEVPTQYKGWQLRCCVELYNMADKQGITNYSENSLSWTKLSDGLSNSLMNKIVSNVGVPRKTNRQSLDDEVYNVVYDPNAGD
jgi:hypothetical protein